MLQLTSREDEKLKAKHLRKKGLVPMALIDKDKNIRLVQAPVLDVRKAVSGAHGMFDVKLDDEAKARSVIVKQVDQDTLTHRIINVILMQVSKDDLITADIPVISIGTPEAVEANTALLVNPTSSVKIKGKISDMPENIEVDVSGWDVGQHMTAGEVQLPAGFELISSPDAMLFSVQIAKEPELEPEVLEEGAEPEVEGETPEEGAEGEAEES